MTQQSNVTARHFIYGTNIVQLTTCRPILAKASHSHAITDQALVVWQRRVVTPWLTGCEDAQTAWRTATTIRQYSVARRDFWILHCTSTSSAQQKTKSERRTSANV